MKRSGHIPCICSLILLSSCTLTQQLPQYTGEEAAAQAQAARELEAALMEEEKRLIAEALEAEKARAAEEARLEAEEKAREEAERAPEAERKASEPTPQLLNSRRKGKAKEELSPTKEQQEAAYKLLAQEKEPKRKEKPRPEPEKEEAVKPAPQEEEIPETRQTDYQLPGSVRSGALRTRRFAPPEEAISRDDNDEPMPNSVEMRGLRSPVMKGNLPMNIDGKIIKEN